MIWPAAPTKSDEMRKQLGLGPLVPKLGKDLWPSTLRARKGGEALALGASLFPTIDDDVAGALVESLTPRVEGAGTAGATGSGSAEATATGTATAAATATLLCAADCAWVGRPARCPFRPAW